MQENRETRPKRGSARKLVVHRETLRLLSEDRLEAVAGGVVTKTCPVITVDCTDRCTLFDC